MKYIYEFMLDMLAMALFGAVILGVVVSLKYIGGM
jgi:hypothetical protein